MINLDGDRFGSHLHDGANLNASMSWSAASHHALVVRAGHEVSTKSSRVNLFQLQAVFWILFNGQAKTSQIDRFSVGSCGCRDIVSVFVTAFDLQAVNADVDQFRDLLERI